MKPYQFHGQERTTPILATIPHGSSLLTNEMVARKKPEVVLANNDWFLNQLYSFLSELNMKWLTAAYSRYVIDLNRNANLEHLHEEYTNSLIYYRTTFGRDIYEGPLSKEVMTNRIHTIYKPFHDRLSEEIGNLLQGQNRVFLLDLHSFYIQSTADVVLGTCGGRSCSPSFLNMVYEAFVSEGFVVKIDEKGLTGGYIVSHYSAIPQVETIQIELRYTTYIDARDFGEEEITEKNSALFLAAQSRLAKVFRTIEREVIS